MFPALVSALGARRNSKTHSADVILFDVGVASPEGATVEKIAAKENIRYIRLDVGVLKGLHITYGRLMVNEVLPAEYEDFIYIDSDTQVWGRLDELVDASVANGEVLGSRDATTVLLASGHKKGAELRRHMDSLNLPETAARDYFNAGIFKTNRTAWAPIAAEAVKLAKSSPPTRFLDQDFINKVAHPAAKIISMRWNFPAFYLGSGLETVVEPRLVHFMSNPRPWQGSFFPWGAKGHDPYYDLVRSYPEMEPYWPRLKPLRHAQYQLKQRYLQVTATPIWASDTYREKFVESEASAAF